jgi:tetratricopeptide (TPR) repeat protein
LKALRSFCVSHEPPLVPEHLFDYAIGIGEYRPKRGAHVSELDPFWDRMRPLAYGAAGNYVIPRAIAKKSPAPELTGVISHRKIVVRNPIGRVAAKYGVYREISAPTALRLPVEEVQPRDGSEFLIAAPVKFAEGVLRQYAHKHHEIDLMDYLALAVQIGVLTRDEVNECSQSTTFIPGGCELGIYPTAWLSTTLNKLETLGREFVTRFTERLRTYDSYQVRAVGFLAERLGSYLLLKELQSRYPQGVPRSLIGSLCVIVPDGEFYSGASVERMTATDGPLPLPRVTLTEKAQKLFAEHQWLDALACFDQLATDHPRNAEIHNYRARTLEALDRHEEALQCLDLALAIDPNNRADLRNRAIVLTNLGRLDAAVASYDAALAVHPDDPDVLVRRAMVLNQLDRRAEALESVNRAVALKPDDPDVLNSRVIILDNLGRYTDALNDIDHMLTLQPDHIDAINNSGMSLARMGRFNEALACYNRSLAINPSQPQAQYNRSLIRLSLGDWIRGFQEFESRWNTAPLNKARLTGLGTLWLGGDEDLSRKTVLLYHEQGYGDTLQCVRYASLIANRGATVILAVPPALEALVQSVPGVSQVIAGAQFLPPHDFQAPLMSMPLAFRTTPDTIPDNVPYLSADADLVRTWKERLGPRTMPRIGLVWGGRRYAPINYPRDVPLAALRPLLSLDVEFISLQTEVSAADETALEQMKSIRQYREVLTEFSQTAALIENLDLVITVDTAIAHLAGALGKPVWLMNRYASCWRWLQDGAGSPWYPTLRQFRQTTVGDWTSVVASVRHALSELIRDEEGRSQGAVAKDPPQGARRIPSFAIKPTAKDKIRFVSATRLSSQEFFTSAPLGRSLPIYRTFPKGQVIELRLFADNREGLSSIYNTAIDESKSDPAILVFLHDDVYLSDYYWSKHLHEALEHFDLVGLAGNKRRVPRQASWMYLDGNFTRDNYDNLSGVLGHGDPFPNLKQLSVYGDPGQEVKLMDGVLMGIRSETLIAHDLRFDPQFQFHFYDLDFCRQAEIKGIRMGTWPISVVHASAGTLGVDSWRAAYAKYLAKYGEI